MSIQTLSSASVRGFLALGPRIGTGPSRPASAPQRSAKGVERQVQPAEEQVEPTEEEVRPVADQPRPDQLRPDQPRPEAPVDTLELSSEAQILGQLSDSEQRVVAELRDRDREVRAHEQAHLAAAGGHATGGPQFATTTGPDGRQYAVGGEVGIDTSPVKGDPEATIRKAQIVRAAAMAPASPSSQDFSVASNASKMEMDARADLRRKEQAEREEAAEPENASQRPIEEDTPEVPLDVYA